MAPADTAGAIFVSQRGRGGAGAAVRGSPPLPGAQRAHAALASPGSWKLRVWSPVRAR